MDLTREAIEAIQETAQKAQTPVKIDVPGDGRIAVYAIGGQAQTFVVTPPPRKHTVRRLASLIDAAQPCAAKCSIWHDRRGVTLLYDDADRRDALHFPLCASEPMTALISLEKDRHPMPQKDFIRLLRFVFGVSPAIVNQFRRLDWENGATSRGEVDKGRDRLGSEIRARVTGTSELPDDLILEVPVYREVGELETVTVRCALEYDAAQQRIELIPMVGEVDAAFEVAQKRIRDRLEEELPEVAIYYGMP